MYGFRPNPMTDHEFAAWLKARYWTAEQHVGKSVHYVNAANETLAVAFYNNETCERDIFTAARFE